LKAENGAAVPVSTSAADGDAPKKGDKKEKKDKKAKKDVESKKEEGQEVDAKQKQGDKGSLRELPSGLKISDAKVGDGPQVKKGMKVSMRYVGKLPNGKIFDSNTKGKPVRRPPYSLDSPRTDVIVFVCSLRSSWGPVR